MHCKALPGRLKQHHYNPNPQTEVLRYRTKIRATMDSNSITDRSFEI